MAAFVKSFIEATRILPGKTELSMQSAVSPEKLIIVKKDYDSSALSRELKGLVSAHAMENEIEIIDSKKGVVMRLANTAVFDTGLAEVAPSAIPLLTKIGDIIKKTSCRIRVEGHTDNVPIRTSRFPSNWELSTARAVNILRHFISESNIPATRLAAAGFSEYKPIGDIRPS